MSWTLQRDALPGEMGAGELFLRARGLQKFQRIFAVIRGPCFEFFESHERGAIANTMHLVLAGCIAKTTPLRADRHGCYYFILVHRVCGTREFFVNSRRKRDIWLAALSAAIDEANTCSLYGQLLKQSNKHPEVVEQRWGVVIDKRLIYFESELMCDPRGVITLSAAGVKAITTYDDRRAARYTMAIEMAGDRAKTYTFLFERAHERNTWVKFIRKILKRDATRSAGPTSPGHDTVSGALRAAEQSAEEAAAAARERAREALAEVMAEARRGAMVATSAGSHAAGPPATSTFPSPVPYEGVGGETPTRI